MHYIIRSMELHDIPYVSWIEREAFPPPWPATNFKRELTSNNLSQYIVALRDDCSDSETIQYSKVQQSRLDVFKSGLAHLFSGAASAEGNSANILGFAGMWFLADEAHLSNIAVRGDYRRQGIGERLLIGIMELAIDKSALFVTLEVRTSNQVAISLYEKYDFTKVGIRPGYYTDNKEDAILMTANMICSSEYRARLAGLKETFALKWGVRF